MSAISRSTLTFTSPKNRTNELGLANSSARLLPARTVILSRDATIGRAALLGTPMTISQHFVGWICGPDLLPDYLLEVLRGPLQSLFASLSFGSTIATIGMPELRELVVPVPPLQEQEAIVRGLQHLRTAAHQTMALISAQLDVVSSSVVRLLSPPRFQVSSTWRSPPHDGRHGEQVRGSNRGVATRILR